MLCEKVFDADQFNPFTRYSIDIREILPRAITRLQKALSRRNYTTAIGVGGSQLENELEPVLYDYYGYYQKMVNMYPKKMREGMYYNPQPIVQQIEEKTIRGVECKIGFYINNKPIVERTFYVDGFNPIARWSTEIVDEVCDIANLIKSKILHTDVKNMWDDYDLINIKGMSINQIRELSPIKREEMLRRLRRN
jgi:methionine aminopeptidase